MVAPYVHLKGDLSQLDETRAEMIVVEDPYGFDPETLDSLRQDQERLRALEPPQDEQGWPESYAEYRSALEKVKETPAYVNLRNALQTNSRPITRNSTADRIARG
jgi:hypothetical protein